jgi:hypothetical protein
MTLSRVLFDSTIELHLDLERVAIHSRATVIRLLQQMEKELVAKVADGVTSWSKARIAKQLSEASAIIRQYYDEAAGIAIDTTTNVAQISASATATSLSAAVGGQVAIGVLPTSAYLETLAGNTIVQGATQAAWWNRQAGDLSFKFNAAVRQGLVATETTPQIVRRVRDVMDVSKRNAWALVHTSVQSVANEVREKVMQDNSDVVAANEYSSTLDRKTCFVKNTMVSVPGGFAPIDKLVTGDLVIGGSGKTRKVIGAMASKSKKLAKITLSNGKVIICTQDHRFKTKSGEWVEAIDLKQGFEMK